MQASKQNLLETLREDLRASFQKTRESFPFSAVKGGIPRGAITEVSGLGGAGKTELVLQFLAENPSLRVAWIEEDFSAYPCAFEQAGVALERVLFVDAGGIARKDAGSVAHKDAGSIARKGVRGVACKGASGESNLALWCAHQVLRSQIFEAVILNAPPLHQNQTIDEVDLKRLQLSAEKSGACLFLIAEEPRQSGTWPLALRLRVSRSETMKFRILNSAPHGGVAERGGVWRSTG